MSIEARFDTEDSTDPRGAGRRTLHLGVSGRFASGSKGAVTVHNISATGLLIETAAALAEGETIVVDLPEAGERHARVVWADAPMHGCRFDDPLTPAALSAAQLRGAVRDGDRGDRTVSEDFGVRLRRLRTERGLSLADIADRLGVSKPTVWAWEHGKARPVERRLAALAEALGVTTGGLEPAASGPVEAVEAGRRQIAEAYGVEPARVRIMIEL
ncbi:helix-turn-helix domain-containing protein [Tsuneonella sp. YG55]|uniref:Helix-turn-helix domain-containing protein n=1 Tax=Tsuneonella litorea TaxID=2976475 RepID=A0A9X2W1C2_9SPHN|nr:helix-turn-helix transcriptional regulator [Tsuneonella litorea]MCT2558996.1 helix-turn-helix domain-containing protein [Tsuneonella litorea]